jgi:mannan endo-1,4-beta-mannosidase
MLKRSFSRRNLLIIVLLFALAGGLIFGTTRFTSKAATSNFVTLSADHRSLRVGDQPFRFAGANIYWLTYGAGDGAGAYKTQINTIFDIVSQKDSRKGMSENVVRGNSLGTGAHCGSCLDSSFFSNVDYVLSQAAQHNIRLVIPFVDNWDNGNGTVKKWTDQRGLSYEQFYTDKSIIKDFKIYIGSIINHVNSLTGVAYKDDPTILAWELGNELNNVPASWIREIAQHIKSQDSNHLVAFGSQMYLGLYYNSKELQNGLSVSEVDIIDAHYYPISTDRVISDAKTVYQAGKAFYVGEYGWNNPISELPSFLKALEANDSNQGYLVSGDTYWSLFPEEVDHVDIQETNENYTIHFPGDNDQRRTAVPLLTQHAQTMTANNAVIGSDKQAIPPTTATSTASSTPPATFTPSTTENNAPVGKTIWLKTQRDGRYVSARLDEANAPLRASSSEVSIWEQFDVVDARKGLIALKVHASGQYVSAWEDVANTPLEARTTEPKSWETFQWVSSADGTVALIANTNGCYVSAWFADATIPLEARVTHLERWETFQWGEV